MVQPEPYEVIHTVQEPIVTHHVSYKEALPAQETISYQSTGLGTQVVDGWQEVLPVEAAHWNDPRIAVDAPRPQTYSGAVRDTAVIVEPAYEVIGAPVVYETAVASPVVYETGPVVYETPAIVGAPVAYGAPVVGVPEIVIPRRR